MRLSWKNMLISFVLALIVLSLAMTVACVAIFNSRVDVRENRSDEEIAIGFSSQPMRYDFSDTRLYYSLYSDGTLRYVALVGICDDLKTVMVTPIDKTISVDYKDGKSDVSDLFAEHGESILADVAAALTGVYTETVIDTGIYDWEPAASTDDFVEQIEEAVSELCENYRFERITVILNSNGAPDYDKTKKQFFAVDSNE